MLDDNPTTHDDAQTAQQASTPARAGRAPRAARIPRVRVSVLARELAVTSKAVLARLSELGESATSASSSVEEGVAVRLRESFAAPTPDDDAAVTTTRVPVGAEAAPSENVELIAPAIVFVAPDLSDKPVRRRRAAKAPAGPPPPAEPVPSDADITVAEDAEDQTAEPEDVREAAAEEATGARRRRRRGRRGRGGGVKSDDESDAFADGDAGGSDGANSDAPGIAPTTTAADSTDADDARSAEDTEDTEETEDTEDTEETEDGVASGGGDGSSSRRRRRRRRTGTSSGDESEDDPPNTVVHVREPKSGEQSSKQKNGDQKGPRSSGRSGGGDGGAKDDDGVRGVKGSTRLEARRQRRRDGRDTNRRRPPILTESEFLARREAVDRVMAVRQIEDRTQIAVLEDNVLVEHYVTRARSTSYVGNVYLGRVQNVLPSMEAAFLDIGKGRNGVLYAGEVNWDAAGLEGKSRAIENALKSGDAVLVQVTKDPIGHKGARLTSQVSLPGRFLVYVPGGGMTGISRRLPDTERHRLKSILKKIVPEDAGVIVRTAAEGASEEDLTHDVERLQAEWATMSKKAEKTSSAPQLVHGEPDLAIRVVRDVFNEDFVKLVVQGEDAWATIAEYIDGVAPDLQERVSRHTGESDLFHDLRVDEQLAKALDRKVYLPSGGSLVIDRTEAMTVVDVNTGKFVGAGGNLEQTVTRNNLEAAEEIVRQLRLRDVGGIVVIDFIDMVLESNRELVLSRLTECLGRDRTKHQVAEVTSLGLVQMTRKRVGEGLLEAFSETCEVCRGRGVILHNEPVDKGESSGASVGSDDEDRSTGKSARRRRGGSAKAVPESEDPAIDPEQRQKALAAMTAIHRAAHPNEYAEEVAPAELEIDAVEAVLIGSPIDAELLDLDFVEALTEPTADPGGAAPGTGPAAGSGVSQVATSPAELPQMQAGETGPGETGPDDTGPDDTGRADGDRNGAAPNGAAPSDPADDVSPRARPRRRRAASRPAGPPVVD